MRSDFSTPKYEKNIKQEAYGIGRGIAVGYVWLRNYRRRISR
jgi:hypothetical protein